MVKFFNAAKYMTVQGHEDVLIQFYEAKLGHTTHYKKMLPWTPKTYVYPSMCILQG